MPTVNLTIQRSESSVRSRDSDGRMEIDATRPRQTDRPATPFRTVLASGVSMLMRGAEVATHVVGGPILAAAVHDARVGVATSAAIGGASVGGAGGMGASPTVPGSGGPGTVEAMLSDGQASNMQLLALQQHIQQENQVFTTVSNVMRAKHDTAKAAVSNVRA